MPRILLKYSVRWFNNGPRDFTLEELDGSHIGLLGSYASAAALKDPVEFLKHRQDWAVCFIEGASREVVFFNAIEAFVRHWRCRRHRQQLITWDPVDERFVGLENRMTD